MTEQLPRKRRRRLSEFIEPFRVTPGAKVRLGKDFDPAFRGGVDSKKQGVTLLEEGVQLLSTYQARLAAQDTWGVLVVLQALDTPAPAPPAPPTVILFVGVNGTGKTTTIGKLAHRWIAAGEKVLLVAGDTFRAAAIDQLKVWGERVGAPVVAHQPGADPSAVVFDALRAARARGADRVLIDTAGRLHTKKNLMEELKKIHRVTARELPGAPHETLLVLDAVTGTNGLVQAKEFHAAVPLTGIILTKLDGTAKGGIAVAIARELALPVRYIGVGEDLDDLQPFDPVAYLDALLP